MGTPIEKVHLNTRRRSISYPKAMEHSMVFLIEKKRDGKELTESEIEFFVSGMVNGNITDTQIGAMLMAIYMKDMTDRETQYLTKAMIQTGDHLSYPESWRGSIVGKHSTGGVGDKVTLVLIPALAACGLKVPKISGRGLGLTGGTLDKLESIPGFKVVCTSHEIRKYVEQAGCCLVSQTNSLVPADKVMYSIRDITATVESIPLIAGSVMSKKAVESLDALVLQLTYGRAAHVKTEVQARKLAHSMIETSRAVGLKTTIVLTKMDHPVGKMIGNSLEVIEAIQCLKGGGPKDVNELVRVLGGHLLYDIGYTASPEEGMRVILAKLQDGSALRRFQAMMVAQGVAPELARLLVEEDCADETAPVLIPSNYETDLICNETGFVANIEGITLADALRQLGACRNRPGDVINHAVGIELLVVMGDHISQGSPWIRVHHDYPLTSEMKAKIQTALDIQNEAPAELSRITDVISCVADK